MISLRSLFFASLSAPFSLKFLYKDHSLFVFGNSAKEPTILLQSSYDKQFVRDSLLSVNFNKRPPGPTFPEEIIRKTASLYLQALTILTGTTLI